jgi:hypothetical protein
VLIASSADQPISTIMRPSSGAMQRIGAAAGESLLPI